MAFYLISPVFGLGTFKEPLLALGISALWGIYGAVYFLRSSKAKGKTVLLETRQGRWLDNRQSHVNRNADLGGITSRLDSEGRERETTQWLFCKT